MVRGLGILDGLADVAQQALDLRLQILVASLQGFDFRHIVDIAWPHVITPARGVVADRSLIFTANGYCGRDAGRALQSDVRSRRGEVDGKVTGAGERGLVRGGVEVDIVEGVIDGDRGGAAGMAEHCYPRAV